jgi:hypothetical protein
MGKPMRQGGQRSTKMGEPVVGEPIAKKRAALFLSSKRQHPLQHPLFEENDISKALDYSTKVVLVSGGNVKREQCGNSQGHQLDRDGR